MTRNFLHFTTWFLVFMALCIRTPFADVAEGRFGGALRGTREEPGPSAEPRPAYNGNPLTVECWAKLNSKSSFNILAANEVKASPTHWEIYSYAGSGYFSAYFPGYTPSEVISDKDITDGKWHYLAMVREGNVVRLYVDAVKVKEVALTASPNLKGQTGRLAFGSLVEGGIGCEGLVDEVRISRIAREISRVPQSPFEADADTVGLWHFDRAIVGAARPRQPHFPDASSLNNPAVMLPASIAAGEAAKQFPHAGPSLVVLPPKPDLVATRQLLKRALSELHLPTLADAGETRDGVLEDWEEQFFHLNNQVQGREKLFPGAAEQAFDRRALVWETDGDPLDVVLRRTTALVEHLKRSENVILSAAKNLGQSHNERFFAALRMTPVADLAAFERDLSALKSASAKVDLKDTHRRKASYLAACALRRRIAFANPLLNFDRILFVARGNYQGSRWTGPAVTGDAFGQHFATQYFAFNSIPGGGLFIVKNFKTKPEIVNVVKDSVVENRRLKGRKLEGGAFLSPDLSYDGKTILFAWTENKEHKWVWSKETTWHIFKVNVDGERHGVRSLRQLTDGAWNDFDPCWLPNGRIAFISEWRGGYIRCFAGLHVPTYVLHSMKADGSDVYPLSYYETSEWHPSVNNDGMLVYTRWDYTDRENCLGSNFWICYPDGRDPRAPHGNYPYPWHTFSDNKHGDSRIGRPYTEMNVRAIPGSRRYVMTAAPHHGESFGSLVLLDLQKPDDGFMSQLKRITPYPGFPESEIPGRSQYPYGTPYPLSEDFYLCNCWENLYLLDRFGNQDLICENSLVFGKRNDDIRLIDPIPVAPRPKPPVLPTLTNKGVNANPSKPKATIAVLNVYDSDMPFPKGTRIKWLRVIQNILKENPMMGVPMIGYQNENTPRIPLGIVPVEEDGSVYFEAPTEKELIFQVLDENYMAVQSMRSVAFVHPGEQLTCRGCHEDRSKAPRLPNPKSQIPNLKSGTPLALLHPPSKLKPEMEPIEPIFYYRHVKPVFEKSCVPCHKRENKGPVDMSYEKLEPYVFFFAGGMRGEVVRPIHGGSRSIPGRFGARASRMGQALLDAHHRGKISEEDCRRIVLWLDCNSPRLGAFHDEEKQVRGEVIWPRLDADPKNPLGFERHITER